ncbi:MAG: nucleotidyltransferase domain-containing protein [Dehalococcoidia bacterium]|nr:nucleotidyltransferase domain-containing protein [Dehalococcoidia bacterium]
MNVLYRGAAEEFAHKVVSALGDAVHCIVLFGSVARKEARSTSDTDVLVIGADARSEEIVFDAAYGVMENSGFDSFITTVYFTHKEFQRLVRMRTSFISNVLEEGSILYDDGTFVEARKRLLSGG